MTKEKKNYRYLMDQLTEYFETTMVPRTLAGALVDIGFDRGYASSLLKRLYQDFPNEMRELEDSHYCMPSWSQGSVIKGYFFVRYRDDIISYINDDLGFGKIYDNLMKDPKNECIDITKKAFMSRIYYFVRNGCSPEIKKAYDERITRKLSRLEEIYKDVMTSEPFKYNVQMLCKKYNISNQMIYVFIKLTKCGNKLMKRLRYKENINCNNVSNLKKRIDEMKLDGLEFNQIAEDLGISEGYAKYYFRSIERIDERISKLEV